MDPVTINGSNVSLRGPEGALVAATVSYSPAQLQATLDPTASLQGSTTYTATIKGGASGVADSAGNRLAADSSWSFTTAAPPPPPPDEGPGGPILVISNVANPFSRYYAEILRSEGLNEFKVTDLANVNAAMLGAYDVVILGETGLSAAQVTTLSNWVQQGGNLIAMRPDAQLAGLLGLTSSPNALANGYLKVDTATGPGAGIVGQTIQFHGIADRYTASGAQTIATLFADAGTATTNPAVTLRSVGSSGGQAAAFTYDLARSIVYTRQGNPAWSGDERDGTAPIRSDDLFFGAKQGDVQPDWIDLSKVAIPQADEQQRLLKNLIEEMNLDRKPLPSFWFLPRDEKAAVVMSGDDHGNGGTDARFGQFLADSSPGCVVADWECVRATSYIYPSTTSLSNAEATAYQDAGFEIGLHLSTNCKDWADRGALESLYTSQLTALAANYPGLSAPVTNRTHCIAWSDWATQPKVELQNGMRLDTNYYYWPPGWVQDRPGMFTGSAMPMRFADLDGSMIDVYQAATQMTDESGQSFPFTIDTLLDRALGAEGYYGVFTANMHTDVASSPGADAIVASAQARGVPIVSAAQMLTWLDGRNNSSFGAIAWNANKLTFTISHAAGANGLRAMVPTASSVGVLTGVKQNGSPVATTTRTVKGREYAFFDAAAGAYEATYAVDDTAPAISNVAHTVSADGTATITWNTNENSDSRVDFGANPEFLTAGASNSALVTAHSVQLTGLDSNTTYYYRVSSADAATNSNTDPAPPAAPRTLTTPSLSFTDNVVADFTAGSPDTNARISQTSDGELILKPTEGDEFSGTGLPTGWASCPWSAPETCAPGAGATVSGGSLHINGNYSRTVATYGSGRNLELVANFGGQSFQHAGFGVDLNSSPNWAIFSVTAAGFFARTNANGVSTQTQLSSSLLGSSHLYRIEWGATDVRYYVDGLLVATHTASFGATQMRPIVSDFNAAAPEVSVDWIRMSAYAGSGAFDSRVFDAGAEQSADWGALTWNASVPSGAGVAISVRTGDTAIPDESWSAFSPIASSGGDIPGKSRYVQYRAQLTASDPAVTPTLSDVSIAYSTAAAPETTIDSGPGATTEDSTPTFAFHSSVVNSTFECSIDTGAANFAPCSGPRRHPYAREPACRRLLHLPSPGHHRRQNRSHPGDEQLHGQNPGGRAEPDRDVSGIARQRELAARLGQRRGGLAGADLLHSHLRWSAVGDGHRRSAGEPGDRDLGAGQLDHDPSRHRYQRRENLRLLGRDHLRRGLGRAGHDDLLWRQRPDQRLDSHLRLHLERAERDLPVPLRRRRVRGLQRPRRHPYADDGALRGRPHLLGPRGRSGRQHRRQPGDPLDHGRLAGARDDDLLRRQRPDQRHHPDLRLHLERVELDLPVQYRLRRLRGLQRPRRDPHAAGTRPGRPHLLGPRDRPGCQRRRDPRHSRLHGRHRCARDDDLLRRQWPDQRLDPDLRLHLERAELDLPVSLRLRGVRRLQRARRNPHTDVDALERRPHLLGPGDRPGHQYRCQPGDPRFHG